MNYQQSAAIRDAVRKWCVDKCGICGANDGGVEVVACPVAGAVQKVMREATKDAKPPKTREASDE
jgi:hypothetical protein